jgi:hypothetical protein
LCFAFQDHAQKKSSKLTTLTNGKEDHNGGSDEEAPAFLRRSGWLRNPPDAVCGAACSRNRPLRANTMPHKPKAGWPFVVQRKPGDAAGPQAQWSQQVTQRSNALDLEPGVFTLDDPQAIAQSLKGSADRSERRKASAFQSAMSMLTFYINRAGSQLPAAQRACLEAAKDELRQLYGRARHGEPALEPAPENKRGAAGAPSSAAPKFIERRSSPGS